MALAGEILLGRGMEGALRAFSRAGRGAAGWAAAREFLADRFPGTRADSLDAVLNRARELVGIGNRYRQGGGGYAVDRAYVPSAVRLERPFVLDSPDETVRNSTPRFRHVVEITLRQPGPNGGYLQTFQDTSVADSPLTRDQWQAQAEVFGQKFTDTFLGYRHLGKDVKEIEVEIRLVGIYQGY